MKNKKADISIFLIFSVVITIAGILLIFVFIANNSDYGKKIYCRSIYDETKRNDPFCEEYLSLSTETLNYRTTAKEHFYGLKKEVLLFNATNMVNRIDMDIPKNAKILNAFLNISLEEISLSRFESGKAKELLVVPPERQDNPPPGLKFMELPENSYLIGTKIEVTGASSPTKADIIFVIDTSSSMTNEWSALCDSLNDIDRKLIKLGLDANRTIYSLGAGGAEGDCVDRKLTAADLSTMMVLPQLGSYYICGGNGCYNPYDDYEESWAVGVSWIAKPGNHDWRDGNDIKRIIIPISDSDPTGGGPTVFFKEDWRNGPQYTGTENPSIQQAIDLCTQPWPNWHYILPIEGDEEGNSEGYGVGGTPCTGQCLDVKGWMTALIRATTTLNLNPLPFDNRDTIYNSLLEILTTPYPNNIEVYINKELNPSPIWTFPGQLDDTNSQQIIDTPEFFDAVRNTCIGGPCTISVVSDEGTVIFDKVRLKYYDNPLLQKISVNGFQMAIPDIHYDDPSIMVDISDILNTALETCTPSEKNCHLTIEFIAGKPGAISLPSIDLEFGYYDLEEDILERILECWRRSNFGDDENDMVCEEFIVNNKYEFNYPITEKGITDLLIERNFCNVIGNLDYSCGEDDQIIFTQDIYNTYNILIEYDSVQKKVVVG
ncbi:MAG: hypothetical protein KKF44_05340 [Nanoarchaeota archaeon]|nr:hypothetical protein [Nanoarchaeota archaeon]